MGRSRVHGDSGVRKNAYGFVFVFSFSSPLGEENEKTKTQNEEIDSLPLIKKAVALTVEQQDAVDYLLDLTAMVRTLGGYAGSGKTTVIKTLRRALPDWGVAAFTGKAAHVLRQKGIKDASTIHSAIYHPT